MALQLFKIASQTADGTANTITFNNIPQGYTDLMVVVSGKTGGVAYNNEANIIQFNSNGSNYSYRYLTNNTSGGAISGTGSVAGIYMGENPTSSVNMTPNTFSSCAAYIPNYTSSNYKTVSVDASNEGNSATYWGELFIAGLWSDTAAITTVKVYAYSSAVYSPNSTFTIYGIL
jgi:hypothetical protein